MAKKQRTFSDTLRRAVEQDELTRYAIYKQTGIDQAVLSKFVRGQRGLSLDSIDKLCRCLRLRLVSEDELS